MAKLKKIATMTAAAIIGASWRRKALNVLADAIGTNVNTAKTVTAAGQSGVTRV